MNSRWLPYEYKIARVCIYQNIIYIYSFYIRYGNLVVQILWIVFIYLCKSCAIALWLKFRVTTISRTIPPISIQHHICACLCNNSNNIWVYISVCMCVLWMAIASNVVQTECLVRFLFDDTIPYVAIEHHHYRHRWCYHWQKWWVLFIWTSIIIIIIFRFYSFLSIWLIFRFIRNVWIVCVCILTYIDIYNINIISNRQEYILKKDGMECWDIYSNMRVNIIYNIYIRTCLILYPRHQRKIRTEALRSVADQRRDLWANWPRVDIPDLGYDNFVSLFSIESR